MELVKGRNPKHHKLSMTSEQAERIAGYLLDSVAVARRLPGKAHGFDQVVQLEDGEGSLCFMVDDNPK